MKKTNVLFRVNSMHRIFLAALLSIAIVSCEKADEALDDIRDDQKKNKGMAKLFTSTNTGGNFAIFDVSDLKDVDISVANIESESNDGIFYDKHQDIVYQVSRSFNRVNAFTSLSDLKGNDTTYLSADFSSSSDLSSGREIAVSGNRIVVADQVPDNHMFFVYRREGNTITLEKSFNVPFPVWGIALDGNTLYAVEDMSDSLAMFDNFFEQPEGDITPTKKVQVEGIVRTHGIYYDSGRDIMILTDIGDADSDDDGGFQIIENFYYKLVNAGDGGSIPLSEQIRVAGNRTFLGNPVDVTMDYPNRRIYIAERARNGGKILGFDFPKQSGNKHPVLNVDYEGAAGVHLSSKMGEY